MITDTVTKIKGMSALVESLGMVGAERFVMLIQKEPFDYSKWRENLFKGKSIDEIHEAAARFYKANA